MGLKDRPSNPVTVFGPIASAPAISEKQLVPTYVSVKGQALGVWVLRIGSTVVWVGQHDANGSDGQNFQVGGIRNGETKGEGIVLSAMTVPTGPIANFGWKIV